MDLRSASTKNYYELLGLSKDATTQEVRVHYHELARVYHPDSNYYSEIVAEKVSPDQIELFKLITAAYQTLSNPQKRKEYDILIAPAMSEKIRVWEEKDSFWDKQAAFGSATDETSGSRPRAATFGQTTAVSRDDLMNENPEEVSLKEIIRSYSKKRTKKILIGALGLLIGLIFICVIIIKFIPLSKSTQTLQPDPKRQQYQAPVSGRNPLD